VGTNYAGFGHPLRRLGAVYLLEARLLGNMAKSDSFFIRAGVDWNGTTFEQTSIDLGAYVDALGKSVLRIHRAEVVWDSPLDVPAVTSDQNHQAAYQITTQSQTSLIDATDKSVVASGILYMSGSQTPATLTMSERMNVAPQVWTNGYLIGVEQIYLGVDQTMTICSGQFSVILECTVETLNQSAAMALALSQQ